VKLLLKILLGMGLLFVLAIGIALASPPGRAFFGIARTLVGAMGSPTAQELVRHGCAMAFVAPLGEIVDALGRIIDLAEDEQAAQIVAENPTMLFCAAAEAKPAPDCADLARAYAGFDSTAPPRFGVLVLSGEVTTCSGYFTPQGERLADFVAGEQPR
jgi:hypothetical protein